MTDLAEVHFDQAGPVGLITLDRQKALNALTHEMVRAIGDRLRVWRDDPSVAAVVVRAAPGRAFCAGGDVRAVVERARSAGVEAALPFFFDEYRMNWRIKTLGKPYVALLDGVTMGGGVGLSVHGTHRVVTEHTLFAMPETAIGFFPDVGGSYFLPRCPGAIGAYLGLTGTRLEAEDCLTAGIGTHHLAAERLPELLDRLSSLPLPGFAPELERILAELQSPPAAKGTLAGARTDIDRFFAGGDSVKLMQRLEASDSPWAREQATVLRRHSPLAVAVTLAQLRMGAGLDFASCMQLEYRMVAEMLAVGEFAEGVRALLIDKDKQPRWRHRAIEDVGPDEVAAILRGRAERLLPLDWQAC